jgi:hypothetical protein
MSCPSPDLYPSIHRTAVDIASLILLLIGLARLVLQDWKSLKRSRWLTLQPRIQTPFAESQAQARSRERAKDARQEPRRAKLQRQKSSLRNSSPSSRCGELATKAASKKKPKEAGPRLSGSKGGAGRSPLRSGHTSRSISSRRHRDGAAVVRPRNPREVAALPRARFRVRRKHSDFAP